MTRTQIGNVVTESNGDEITVYVDQYGAEEIDSVTVSGKACNIAFDPSTMIGRTQLRALAARLIEAIDAHDKSVEEIYGKLKVGDWCMEIRLPVYGEKRCMYHASERGQSNLRCSRVQHEDFLHVAVNDDFEVLAVRRATDRVLPGLRGS